MLRYILIFLQFLIAFVINMSGVYAGNQKLNYDKAFDDCNGAEWCPKMVVIKGGDFMMGALKHPNIPYYEPKYVPPRKVSVKTFAVGQFEVTRGQFHKFITETEYKIKNDCVSVTRTKTDKQNYSYLNPGFPQSDFHPAVCINWHDANAYVNWLSKKTGKKYRLLTDAEWEYAARAVRNAKAPNTSYFFGNNKKDLCQYDNHADGSVSISWANKSCIDGVGNKTAPVGSYKSNKFGLYDLYGNALEWVNASYYSMEVIKKINNLGDHFPRVLRGGSWGSPTLGSALRMGGNPSVRLSIFGFRVARSL